MSSVNLSGVHSAACSRLLTEILNSTGARIETWGTMLVTGLQLDMCQCTSTPSGRQSLREAKIMAQKSNYSFTPTRDLADQS